MADQSVGSGLALHSSSAASPFAALHAHRGSDRREVGRLERKMTAAKRHPPVGARTKLQLWFDHVQHHLFGPDIADIAPVRDEAAAHIVRIDILALDLSDGRERTQRCAAHLDRRRIVDEPVAPAHPAKWLRLAMTQLRKASGDAPLNMRARNHTKPGGHADLPSASLTRLARTSGKSDATAGPISAASGPRASTA